MSPVPLMDPSWADGYVPDRTLHRTYAIKELIEYSFGRKHSTRAVHRRIFRMPIYVTLILPVRVALPTASLGVSRRCHDLENYRGWERPTVRGTRAERYVSCGAINMIAAPPQISIRKPLPPSPRPH